MLRRNSRVDRAAGLSNAHRRLSPSLRVRCPPERRRPIAQCKRDLVVQKYGGLGKGTRNGGAGSTQCPRRVVVAEAWSPDLRKSP